MFSLPCWSVQHTVLGVQPAVLICSACRASVFSIPYLAVQNATLGCSTRHACAYLVENHMSVKPAIIRMRERCSTLVVAAAADDEGDGEGTEIKLISFALPVAYSGL